MCEVCGTTSMMEVCIQLTTVQQVAINYYGRQQSYHGERGVRIDLTGCSPELFLTIIRFPRDFLETLISMS